MKRLFLLLGISFLALAPLACKQTYTQGPLSPSPNNPTATMTKTPSFSCGSTTTPSAACPDPYATPSPSPTPCLSSPVPNGQAWLEICNYSNNGLTKQIWIQTITFASNWPSLITLSPGNQLTSLGAALYISYNGSQIGTWDGTDQYGNPVANGCYAVHLRYTDSLGSFQELFLPITVNRPVGRLLVTIRDATNKAVRLLYSYTANPGVGTNASSMSLSTGSFQPSYCNMSNSIMAISLSNAGTLVWDGKDDNGTILPAGTYTIAVCSTDGSTLTQFTSPVVTAPLNETSAATTVWASPNPATAGSTVLIQAVPCAAPLGLLLRVYDSGNYLVRTVPANPGTNQTALDTTGLSAGTYQVKVGIYDPFGLTGTETVSLILN